MTQDTPNRRTTMTPGGFTPGTGKKTHAGRLVWSKREHAYVERAPRPRREPLPMYSRQDTRNLKHLAAIQIEDMPLPECPKTSCPEAGPCPLDAAQDLRLGSRQELINTCVNCELPECVEDGRDGMGRPRGTKK